MTDLLNLLTADPYEDPDDPPAARVRAPAGARGPTPNPFAPAARLGLTYEQAQALIADLENLERQARDGLERVSNGGAATGASVLRKVYNRARDTKRWAERHLDENNPDILHVEPLE